MIQGIKGDTKWILIVPVEWKRNEQKQKEKTGKRGNNERKKIKRINNKRKNITKIKKDKNTNTKG